MFYVIIIEKYDNWSFCNYIRLNQKIETDLLQHINSTNSNNMAISKQECDKTWSKFTTFQKKELISLWEEQQEKKKKYDLNDDVWGLIKEFAGIYHITTEWDKVMKVSSSKLYEWYRKNTKYSISNLYKSNAKEQKEIILNFLYKKQRNKKTMENLYYLILPHIETKEKVTKPVKEKKDFTKYRVGQEVVYQIPLCDFKCGIIRRVNKASINVDFYEEKRDGRSAVFQKNKFSSNKTIRANFKSDDELWEKSRLNHRVSFYSSME